MSDDVKSMISQLMKQVKKQNQQIKSLKEQLYQKETIKSKPHSLNSHDFNKSPNLGQNCLKKYRIICQQCLLRLPKAYSYSHNQKRCKNCDSRGIQEIKACKLFVIIPNCFQYFVIFCQKEVVIVIFSYLKYLTQLNCSEDLYLNKNQSVQFIICTKFKQLTNKHNDDKYYPCDSCKKEWNGLYEIYYCQKCQGYGYK